MPSRDVLAYRLWPPAQSACESRRGRKCYTVEHAQRPAWRIICIYSGRRDTRTDRVIQMEFEAPFDVQQNFAPTILDRERK
jgi:hypothetical protein